MSVRLFSTAPSSSQLVGLTGELVQGRGRGLWGDKLHVDQSLLLLLDGGWSWKVKLWPAARLRGRVLHDGSCSGGWVMAAECEVGGGGGWGGHQSF